MNDFLPAHFLSSSMHEESTLTAAYAHRPLKAPPSPDSRKKELAPPGSTSPARSPRALTRSLSTSATTPPPGVRPSPQPTSPASRAQGMPAPIGIPASRRRSPSAAASMRPPLSSSPTHTPFSVTPVAGAPPPARLGAAAAIPQPIIIPRTPSPPGGNNQNRNGTPSLSPTLSPHSPPTSVSPPSPQSSPKRTAKVLASPVLKRGEGIHVTPTANSGNGQPNPASTSPKKGRTWGRFFDFDHMLGALDPNRLAVASCPEPTKTVVFGAETEAGITVCRTLVAARHYAITALTVDDQCAAADELREYGVRVVAVDMDSPASYAKELAGAQAVYLSSNVMALHTILHHQPEPKRTEIARAADRCQLSKAVQACSRAKVGHVVFRVNACGHEVVENVLYKPPNQGDSPVSSPIGTSKVAAALTEAPTFLDKQGITTTVLHTTVPFNRITEWLEDSPRGLVLNVPVPDDTRMPLFHIEQTGEYVLAALRNPKKWGGHEMHAISDMMTPIEIAAHLSRVSRRPVDTMHPTREEFMSFESHERLTLRWDAWAQLVRGEYQPSQAYKATKADVPEEMDFATWLVQDRDIHQRLKF